MSTAAVQAADLTVDPAPAAPMPNLVQVVVPQARWAAVSDTASFIAFAIKPEAAKSAGVAIFGIDASGNIVGTPVPPPAVAPGATPPPAPPPLPLYTIELPKSAALAAFPNYAMSVLFHPKLPLLYVWQEITGPPFTSAKTSPVFAEFDHLLVYSLAAGQPPKLMMATARGPGFWYSCPTGILSLDAAGKRLCLPNLRLLAAPDNSANAIMGYATLDEQGMPQRDGEKLAVTTHDTQPYAGFPPVNGCYFVSDTVAIFAGLYGPITWDLGNRRAKFCNIALAHISPYTFRMTNHPTLPVVYLTGYTQAYLYSMEHADGYLTMLPQLITMTGPALVSPPVFMTRQNKVAVGSGNRVVVFNLDKDGRFITTAAQTAVTNPLVEAVTYSEKFDKLYVAVEKAP